MNRHGYCVDDEDRVAQAAKEVNGYEEPKCAVGLDHPQRQPTSWPGVNIGIARSRRFTVGCSSHVTRQAAQQDSRHKHESACGYADEQEGRSPPGGVH